MRGPIDGTDQHILKNMVTSQAERFDKRSMNRRTRISRQSGTCNVCSAPCSSCMHFNRSLMGSKTDEFSDETCRETMASQDSINNSDVLPSVKGRVANSVQHTASEASNLLSISSSHDSFSENAESKTILRFPDISDNSEDFEMNQKLYSDGIGAENQLYSKPEKALDQRIISNKYEDNKSLEGHDDNISCISRANDANTALSHHDKDVDIKSSSYTSASVCSLGVEGSGKDRLPQKLNLADIPSSEKAGISGCFLKVQSPLSQSPNGLSLNENNSGVLMKKYPKSEPEIKSESEINKTSGDAQDGTLRCTGQHEQNLKSTEKAEITDMQEPSLQAAVDENEDSDVVEHDVKVCDICGDAGREDLLAICSKCSDGAEHTYCMKEMLEKLPEGDWLCEECKFAEESENQKQDFVGSDAEGKRTNKISAESSGKRCAEEIEPASAAKRQALDIGMGTPKSSSLSKTAVLSRDSSFKSLDKGKVRPAALGTHSRNDVSETARSPTGSLIQKAKGALSKSNSFNTLNSKPKVKLVEDVVPQKQRGTRELAALDTKDGSFRAMGKSKSFRYSSSGLSSASESKFRKLSPRVSGVQDFKGSKPVKDRNALERKTLSKLDRSVSNSTVASSAVSTPRVDQKLASRGDDISFSSANNNRETKVVKSEGKVSLLSKSNSNLARKGGESPVTSVGALATNGNGSSIEHKSNLVSPKDEPSSTCSWTAERPSSNDNEVRQDGLPRSLESSTQSEKGSVGRPRSTGRNLKGEMMDSSNLKAAIVAALPKLSVTYSKKKLNDQSDAVCMTSVDLIGQRDSQDQSSVSNKVKNITAVRGMHEPQVSPQNCSTDSCKPTIISHLKQFSAHSIDPLLSSRVGDSSSPMTSSAKTASRDGHGHSLAAVSAFLKMSAIPEHEYIWQGAFEVHRGEKPPDLCGGIQAHLSSCASPKVPEEVNKFSQKIQLNEVTRLSTWPTKFHETGVKEENIALYFFAKDYESYERNYKGLLDTMIKSDLALKGTIDGLELLIFPSNLLPDNCKRWNMLYFLWGVFRGRKINCSNSSKNSCFASSIMMPLNRDTAIDHLASSQNLCLPKHIDKDSSICESSHNIAPAVSAPDRPGVSVGDRDNNISSVQQTSCVSRANSERQDVKLESGFLLNVPTTSAELSSEVTCLPPSMEVYGPQQCVLKTELKPSLQAISTKNGSNEGETVELHRVAALAGEDGSSMKVYPASIQDIGIKGSIAAEETADIMKRDRDQVKLEGDLKEEAYSREEAGTERNSKGLNCQQPEHRKRPYLDLSEPPQQLMGGTSQNLPWNNVLFDGQNKRLKTDFSGCSSSRVGDDLGSSSSIEEKRYDKLQHEKIIPEDMGATEKYFFPVDTQGVDNFRMGPNSMQWRELPSKDEDQRREVVPNLELALGAETKPMLPFFGGPIEKDNQPEKPPDKVAAEEEDLSLSLSFPFPDKEPPAVKPVQRTEQLLSERRHVNTSLLLFGGFLDK